MADSWVPASQQHHVYPYVQLPAPFAADALAPAITAGNLEAHRAHHRQLIAAVNAIVAARPALQPLSIEQLLTSSDAWPQALRDTLFDVAGAHANHQFLWKVLRASPPGIVPNEIVPNEPVGALREAINRSFGGFAAFRREFTTAALSLRQEGWVFLSLAAPRLPGDPTPPALEILALPGNRSVLPIRKPGLLVCDLWRHAWENDHPDLAAWLDAWWPIVAWDVCEARYQWLALGGPPAP